MITREDLRSVSLLAGLPPDQIDAIAARAADLTLDPGDWLIREGEQAAFFFPWGSTPFPRSRWQGRRSPTLAECYKVAALNAANKMAT